MARSKKIIGVLGYPVAHSKSPDIFATFFQSEAKGISDWEYHKFAYEDISTFIKFLEQNNQIIGFNVTIPHKQNIIPYLDYIDENAQNIGAVNTVKVKRNANKISLSGYNTDYQGFLQSLNSLPYKPQYAVVLGTGGSSKAVVECLRNEQIPFVRVSRDPSKNNIPSIAYHEVSSHLNKPQCLLVNTTPVGMTGISERELPLPFDTFPPGLQVIDLVYTPPSTPLIEKCQQKGITCMNGWQMLQTQAEKAWEIFKK